MRLKAGQPAPNFTERDMYERTVSLSQYWGRKVLLSFYRAAVCPLCNLRLRYMIDHHDDYRRQGLEIIAFFESSPEMVRRYLERQRPPFPVIPDLGRVVYEQYGLESSFFGAAKARLMRGSQYREAARYRIGGGFWLNIFHMDGVFGRRPADFLLGADLRVQTVYYGRDAGDFMPFAEIDRFLMTRPESRWPNYGNYGQPQPSAPANPASGYSNPPTSGRSYPGPQSGRSAPGNYPSGQTHPGYPGQQGSGNSGWGDSGQGNSGW